MDKITKTFVDGTTVINAEFLNELITKVNALIDKYNNALGKVVVAFDTTTSEATLSADNSTAIYYTTDGSVPTTSSSQYSSAISLDNDNVLTAIATDGTNVTAVPAVSVIYNSTAKVIALSVATGQITYSKDGGSATAYTSALDATTAATYTIYVDGIEASTIVISA